MASIPNEHVVKIRAELDNAVIVRPGDTLVIAIAAIISQQQAADIKADVAEELPGVEAVILSGCSGLAVYRDEQPDHDSIKRWIQLNPQEFERWVRKQNRINGA